MTLNWNYDVSKIQIPYFMAAGTGLLDAGEEGLPEVVEDTQEISISPLWSQEENYSLIPNTTPKLRARRTGADHAEMLPWGDGYMTAWFMYWLQGDQEAGKAFFGAGVQRSFRTPAGRIWRKISEQVKWRRDVFFERSGPFFGKKWIDNSPLDW